MQPMRSLNEMQEMKLAEAWNRARQALLQVVNQEQTLGELASEVDAAWPYVHNNSLVRQILDKNWDELKCVHGFGVKKINALLTIVKKAAKDRSSATLPNKRRRTRLSDRQSNVSHVLTNLGLSPAMPIEVIFVSKRARSLCQREHMRDLGQMLEFLLRNDIASLSSRKGIGETTAEELHSLMQAICSSNAEEVMHYLPLRKCGNGVCFSAFASLLLSSRTERDKIILDNYFIDKKTLQISAQRNHMTRGRTSQIVLDFLTELGDGLTHFPEEKQALWNAWEGSRSLAALLSDELDAIKRQLVANALNRLFSKSAEGRAIIEYRRKLFHSWWKMLQESPGTYFGGIRISRFLREQATPNLLVPFLDYLEAKPEVKINRTAGTVKCIRAPLKRIVSALWSASDEPLLATEILKRFEEEGFFPNHTIQKLETNLNRWLKTGELKVN